MIANIGELLIQSQNPDGGWGFTKGKRSNTEATAFALLGLSTWGNARVDTHINPGLAWLRTRQNEDGSWPLTDQLRDGSWATSLTTFALTCYPSHRQSAQRGSRWLLRQKGRRLGWYATLLYRFAPHWMSIQLNPDLQGWAWHAGTFSWVEPTAYALMALKKLRSLSQADTAEARIRQGELLLYDRLCVGGGWNYGNVTVLDEQLHPYPDITALSLIALQDHPNEKAKQQSLQSLREMLTHVDSGLALSWATLCFALYGHDVSAWRTRLMTSYNNTGFLGETKVLALALLALGDGANIFKV